MQPSTLDVRNAYRAAGFIPALYPHVADDHIALELDFLARMAQSAFSSYAENDLMSAHRSLATSKKFMDEHLLAWIDAHAQAIIEKGASDFYSKTAKALASFVHADAQSLATHLAANT